MSLKITDRIPVKEKEIDTEAQNTDVELNVLLDAETSNDEINVDALDALKKFDYKKRPCNLPITEVQGLLKLKGRQQKSSKWTQI